MKEYIELLFEKQDIFFECILLEYVYSKEQMSFTWVGRPGLFSDISSSNNAFLKISFKNVQDFIHIYPDFEPNKLRECDEYFFAKNYSGVYEAEYSEISNLSDAYSAKIVINYLLGELNFKFKSVEIDILYAKSIGVNNEFLNIETGESIDFYRPFGNI